MADHELMGGKLHVYKRENSRFWQCSTFLGGKNRRTSTKEEGLPQAKDFAEDWYLELKGKHKRGELKNEKTFSDAAEKFLVEYDVITGGQRNPRWVQILGDKIRLHLNPFFGDLGLSEVTAGKVQEYRFQRLNNTTNGKPPARSTLHHEIVALRQVLKTATRHGWLAALPDLSTPYRSSGKITHRAWFSPEEYKLLYEATRARARKPKSKRWKWTAEQMHDYVLFMANTGLRPDEALRLEYRDVQIVEDDATGETILEIEVRGKRGVGYCKSMAGAVRPFERLKARPRIVAEKVEGSRISKMVPKLPQANDLVFPGNHRELLNQLLDELKLKLDRDGNRRTAYSLRHTYICMRLMEGADIYAIAKNCRTSVEMIEKFYASHIKNTLDAAAINVRRSRPPSKKKEIKNTEEDDI